MVQAKGNTGGVGKPAARPSLTAWERGPPARHPSRENPMSAFLKSLAAALLLLLLIVGLGYFLHSQAATPGGGAGFRLPLLAIAGVVSLLLALTLAALAFGAADLTDKNQALALPNGSIRAIIALSLIVFFAISAIHLYDSLSGGSCEVKEVKVDLEAAKAWQDKAAKADSAIEIINIVPALPSGNPPAPPAGGNPQTPPAGPFTISYRFRMSPQAADFAKQLLTLLGTLVTSISSFYFGSRAVESKTAPTGSTPGSSTPAVTGPAL